MRITKSLVFACLVIGFISARTGLAEEKAPPQPFDAKAAFERLKTLAGDWEGTAAGTDGAKHTPPEAGARTVRVNYRVAAQGSAIIETYYAGDPSEMISVFTMDGPDKLVLTHYCALRNQPHMKMEKTEKSDEIKFAFDGGTNFDPEKDLHVHEGKVRFLGDDKIESSFVGFKDGKALRTNTLILTRKK